MMNPGYGGNGVVWSPDSMNILISTDGGDLLAYGAESGDYVVKHDLLPWLIIC
jgi:membrane protease subunit (stomatin/prohibitin family)